MGASIYHQTMTAWRNSLRWQIRQAGFTNEAALDDLQGGSEAVLVCGSSPEANLEILAGVMLDIAPVACLPNMGDLAWGIVGAWDAAGTAANSRHGALAVDPIGVAGQLGPAGEAALISIASSCAGGAAQVRSVGVSTVSGTADAGGSAPEDPAYDVGVSISIGIAYLRAMVDGGLSATDAAQQIEFRYKATANQFVSIAKLRAARRLWARVLEVSAVDSEVQQQQWVVVGSPATDEWRDVLANTSACFAAGVGGADAITVLPLEVNSDRSCRLALNTHHLLLDEAHVSEFVDVAAGADHIETLGERIAQEAWQLVQAIEQADGMAEVLDVGKLDAIKQAWRPAA